MRRLHADTGRDAVHDDRIEIQRWIEQARAADPSADDGAYHEAVFELCQRGDAATFEALRPLLDADDPADRRMAIHGISQLGVPERTLPEEGLEALAARLAVETDPTVLQGLGEGLGHLDHPGAVQVALPLAKHADARVRFGAVQALSRQDDPRAIEALIALSADADAEVRDWATFALGSQTTVDTPALRAALYARLDDPELHGDIRDEALVGLAERGDRDAVPHIARSLAEGLSPLAIEAASLLGEPSLHGALVALRAHPDMTPHFKETLDEAIARCDPDAEV